MAFGHRLTSQPNNGWEDLSLDGVVLSIWLDLALERIARAVLLLFLILGRRCANDTWLLLDGVEM